MPRDPHRSDETRQTPPATPTTATPDAHSTTTTSAAREERARRTQDLYDELGASADTGAREALLTEVVELNLGVAEAVARRFRGRGIADDDLEQTAMEALVKAVQRFDPSVRPDLLTYAVPSIRGALQRHLRDHGWSVRPPRSVQELQWRIGESIEELAQQLGRQPSVAEVRADVAEHTDADADQVREALAAFGLRRAASLDGPAGGSAEGGLSLGESLADPTDPAGDKGSSDSHDERAVAAAEARVMLAPVVRDLGERDRRIVYLRFFEERSQSEIGDELGVTQMQVSRLLTRILGQLRRDLDQRPAG